MLRKRLTLVAILLPILASLDCDPYVSIKRMLQDQGFILIQPAREYVRPGGLMAMDKKGALVYFDPSVKFDSSRVVTAPITIPYDHDQSAPLDLVLGLVGDSVKVPVGLKIEGGAQQVSLEAIDLESARINMSSVDELLSQADTVVFIRQQLNTYTRVFVVQEILTVKSAELKSANGNELKMASTTTPGCSSDHNPDQPSVQRDHDLSVSICGNSRDEITLKVSEPLPIAVRLGEIVATENGVRLRLSSSLARDVSGVVKRAPSHE